MSDRLLYRLIYPRPSVNRMQFCERFKGRWVVITGASSGIGKALALLMIEAGANLFLIARREEELQRLCQQAKEKGCQAFFQATDLRDSETLDLLIKELRNKLPRLDYLFCNAGKSIHRHIVDAVDRMHDYDRTMAVNYRSMVALSLALLPLLRIGQQTGQKGQIIYTSSISTLYPAAPGWSAYHASKSAANVWCQTADTELSKEGIHVKIAYMPLVHTPMSDVNPDYVNLPGYTAEDAANILLRLAMNGSRSYKPWWVSLSVPLASLFAPIIRFIYRYQ